MTIIDIRFNALFLRSINTNFFSSLKTVSMKTLPSTGYILFLEHNILFYSTSNEYQKAFVFYVSVI